MVLFPSNICIKVLNVLSVFVAALSFAKRGDPMHNLQYNPVYPQYIATVAGKATPKLWDVRHLKRYVTATYLFIDSLLIVYLQNQCFSM